MARTISTYLRAGQQDFSEPVVHLKRAVIDLTGLTDILAADTIQCLTLPANTFVLDVAVRIITPAVVATAMTGGIGDGGSTAGWDSSTGIDFAAAAGTVTKAVKGTDARAVANSTLNYEYATSDTIDVLIDTVTGAVTSGPKFEILALCIDGASQ